ncbi:uroporphyrinogen-III synthase [Brachybacterium muris]|uniref:uroporphyrinogen-III synthase n=1 Tax=Brachybacterium muris TaxID=219301 RepID=UPI00223BF79D|nr:uroporphyrinogen-III synthase [Brachybacterium muris]MCT2260261.1 uroporphyrinogen-III synthase [Brachybacterium muris]
MTTPTHASAPHAAPSYRGAARVLLPRPAGRGGNLTSLLQEAGLMVEHHPFVELRLHEDAPLRDAARDLAAAEFDHLVLTSPRAVDALLAGGGLVIPPAVTVTVVGEGTASALRSAGREPDRIASGSGVALVGEFPDAASPGARVLFPSSAAAAPTVPEGLAAKGYQVAQVVAYSPHPADLDPQVTGSLRTGGYAAVVLTSSMIARIAAQIGIHPSTRVVTIGDPTTAQARTAGLTVHRQADAPTDQALADAVLAVLADPGTADPEPADPEPAEPDSSAPDPEEDPS